MKRIVAQIIVLGCMFFPAMVHAQTVTITSTRLGDSAGNLYSGVVMFQPTLSSGIPTSYRMGGGGATTSAMIQTIAARGVFSISVPDVTLTFPAPICLKLIAPGLTTGYNCLQPHATATSSSDWCQSGVCNLDNYPPNIAPQVTVQTGPAGPAGPAGPNSVSTSTSSTISGLLKGAAGKVAQAVAGTDYALPGGAGLPSGCSSSATGNITCSNSFTVGSVPTYTVSIVGPTGLSANHTQTVQAADGVIAVEGQPAAFSSVTSPAVIPSNITPGTSPVCANGSGGALTATGCTGSATVVTFTKVQDNSGWLNCGTSACAGGTNVATILSNMVADSTYLSSTAAKIGISGTSANGLFYFNEGAYDRATAFSLSENVYFPTLTGVAALEYDMYQYVGGYKIQMGAQCNFNAGYWDVWNQSSGTWVHTTVVCSSATFAAGIVHALGFNWITNPTGNTYTPVSLIIDGTTYSLSAYGPYTATNLGWSDNTGIDEQIDLNSTGGSVYEWIDNVTMTLTIPGVVSTQVAANLASSGSTGVTGVLPYANGGTAGNITGGPGVPSGNCASGTVYINGTPTSVSTLMYGCYPANTWNSMASASSSGPSSPSYASAAGMNTLVFDQESTTWDIGTSGTHNWYCPDYYYHSNAGCTNATTSGGVLNLLWTTSIGSPYDVGIGTMSPAGGTAYTAWTLPFAVEVSAQMPPLNGGWPAIWMQNIGATLDYTGTSPTTKNYAELDIIEGNSANISTAQAYSSSIHDWYCTGSSCTVSDRDNNNSSNTVSIGSTNMSNFHTWGVLVTTTGVYWYLDGALVNTALCSAHANFCAAAQASPMYLMLSDQVGTNWGNTGVAYPSTSATLNVQWVHVWK